MHIYTELVFALAENVAATLRRNPMTDIKALAKDLYVQTFEFFTDEGIKSGTAKGVVDEEGFYDDLVMTLHAI